MIKSIDIAIINRRAKNTATVHVRDRCAQSGMIKGHSLQRTT